MIEAILPVAVALAMSGPIKPLDVASDPITVVGKATWFRTRIGTAAAGPRLRHLPGPWRGKVVRVRHDGIVIKVRLTDWCRCPNGRVIDLARGSFARLADPDRGVIRVRVTMP